MSHRVGSHVVSLSMVDVVCSMQQLATATVLLDLGSCFSDSACRGACLVCWVTVTHYCRHHRLSHNSVSQVGSGNHVTIAAQQGV
jgi:hypothetical protein